MEMTKFIENFADQFDDINVAERTPETAFRGLDGWSSLIALMVITMIDEEYEVTITGDEMKKQNTIGELYNLVASKL